MGLNIEDLIESNDAMTEAIQQMRKLADNFNLPENKDRTFTGEFVYLAIQDTLDSEQ